MTRVFQIRIFLIAIAIVSTVFGTGCGRMGLGLNPGMVYDNSVGPLTSRRPDFSRGHPVIFIPPDLKTTTVTAHQVSFNVPLLLPPGASRILTVGWGDVSQTKAYEEGAIPSVVFADARTISILGIYTKIIVTAYSEADDDYDGPVWSAIQPRDRQ